MANRLEDNLTWKEICDKVVDKVGGSFKTQKEKEKFIEWFMVREKVGFRFDPNLIHRCYKIWLDLHNNLDHFVVISGGEGLGKSTLGIQIASWIYPEFQNKDIVYGTTDYLEVLQNKYKEYEEKKHIDYSAMILDEGTELLSKEALSKSNRILTKTFFVQRALKMLVIINIPNFHMLDAVVRKHRVKTLIEVTGRGRYKAIVGQGIKIICKDGERNKTINNVRIPLQYFWEGYFQKEFPKNLDAANYEDKKMKGIGSLLSELKNGSTDNMLIPIEKVCKVLGASNFTVRGMCKRGELKATMLAGRRFIYKDSVEEAMKRGANPDNPPSNPQGLRI